jgi:hypothetical protein
LYKHQGFGRRASNRWSTLKLPFIGRRSWTADFLEPSKSGCCEPS